MRPNTATGSATGSIPNTRTVPVSARNRPRTCLIKVVLPAPFSPTRPNTLPRGTSNDTPFKTVLEPNRRERLPSATTDSRMFLPLLIGAAERQFVLDEPPDFIFTEFEIVEPVHCRLQDS